MALDRAKVERFITAAMKYKGDRYSQPKRLQKGFSDCSSLIQKALDDIGMNTRKGVAVTTHRMGIEGDFRFARIDRANLMRGDILWGGNYINSKWEGHVAIYLGEGKTLEARVREGVDFNKDRPYFTRVYRIRSLYDVPRKEDASKPIIPTTTPKVKPIQNVQIFIYGNLIPARGYIVNGTTFLEVNGATIGVRKFFEGLKMKVDYRDGKVYIN